jgi:hypothetical protein
MKSRHLTTLLALALAIAVGLPTSFAQANFGGQDTPSEIVIGASHIKVQVAPGNLALPRSAILAWVRHSATAVSRYYGHFPIARAIVHVTPIAGSGLGFATTDCEEDRGVINIPIGDATTQSDLDKDWVLTHEMVHLAFPLVYQRDRWLVEGMATYIEPLARMQAGYLNRESIWGDLVTSLPRGLPKTGDQGLNEAHSIGRVYWGGALFCLLADLEIRKATGNKKGLQNALREIDSTNGDITSDMEVIDALRLGDKEIGAHSHILEALYNKMKDQAVAPNLDKLWQDLGVKKTGVHVTFDDQAPLAATRKAIEAGR